MKSASIFSASKGGMSLLLSLKAIGEGVPVENPVVHIASAEITGNSLSIRYSVSGTASGPAADIFAVVASDAPASKVLRGENAGSTLAHAAVARSFEHLAAVRGASDEKTARIAFDRGLVGSSSLHLVLFAQAGGTGKVLSVATIPLK